MTKQQLLEKLQAEHEQILQERKQLFDKLKTACGNNYALLLAASGLCLTNFKQGYNEAAIYYTKHPIRDELFTQTTP